ncbi:hypothetical protein ADK53_07510 [Streptomyces sp. WM6373]|nr:hypothetical protein ADK53_07510 [Streptomyces sp. WM6373]
MCRASSTAAQEYRDQNGRERAGDGRDGHDGLGQIRVRSNCVSDDAQEHDDEGQEQQDKRVCSRVSRGRLLRWSLGLGLRLGLGLWGVGGHRGSLP